MSDAHDWNGLFAQAVRPMSVTGHTLLRSWATSSAPVLLACDDGNEYVVKGRQVGRAVVNDQIIGRLGSFIGAPVGSVALVDVPSELVTLNPQMRHVLPGLAHGCRFVPRCSERQGVLHATVGENRVRYASLAILYGWASANDHQFFFSDSVPYLVYSFDHGHFFPGGPQWTTATLASAPAALPDTLIVSQCGLRGDEIDQARSTLSLVTPEVIANAIATVPIDWGLSEGERECVGEYLFERCVALR
jgi:hypothetical protein